MKATTVSLVSGNIGNLEALREKFPAKFAGVGFCCPPEDSEPMYLAVYRACRNNSGELQEDDFLSMDQERPVASKQDKGKPEYYAVSFFETKAGIERILKFSKHINKKAIKGWIKCDHGFARRQQNIDKHVSLWKYEDTTIWLDFENDK